jgi:secondary thiamine-phosphate synthase enzyme
MNVHTTHIALTTTKQFELIDITEQVSEAITKSGIEDGIALVYNPHTTAAIRINHNEPLLMQDIMKMLYRIAPVDLSYSHDLFEVRENVSLNERSNGHAHVKAFLLGSSESLIVKSGKPILGEKQSIFFVELDGGRKRDFQVSVLGGK